MFRPLCLPLILAVYSAVGSRSSLTENCSESETATFFDLKERLLEAHSFLSLNPWVLWQSDNQEKSKNDDQQTLLERHYLD